jgi:hypothetical protein
MSSLYGSLIKQEADYTTTCDERIPECEKLALVKTTYSKQNPFLDF